MISPITFGERFRLARTRQRLKQSDFGMSKGFISDVEHGKRDMSGQRIVRVCRILRVTPNWLLGLVPEDREVVLCAANWYPDLVLPEAMDDLDSIYWLPQNVARGVVYSGRHHLQCMYQCYQTFGLRQCEVRELQGFLTSHNRWLTRDEAGQVAFDAGQIEKPKYLFSEDLWGRMDYQQYPKREVPEGNSST